MDMSIDFVSKMIFFSTHVDRQSRLRYNAHEQGGTTYMATFYFSIHPPPLGVGELKNAQPRHFQPAWITGSSIAVAIPPDEIPLPLSCYAGGEIGMDDAVGIAPGSFIHLEQAEIHGILRGHISFGT